MSCIFFEAAINRAKELDAYLEREGKIVGELHGIPISLKVSTSLLIIVLLLLTIILSQDQFRVKGTETVMGYVSWIGNNIEEGVGI